MRLARISLDNAVHLARIDGDVCTLLRPESDHPSADVLREALAGADDLSASGRTVSIDEVRLLAPVIRPSKIVAIGLNYADHARESGAEVPKAPLLFSKPPSGIVGPGDVIRADANLSTQVDYEAELAVVIGSRCAGEVTDPLTHVFGYTICNDVSARDAQFADGQWVRGKSFDTHCPLGPWLVTADEIADPQALRIGCTVDGEKLQDGTTSDMIFSVAEIISYVAKYMTLEPGDVIATGTPYGVGFARDPQRFLTPGSEVVCWVEGIGELANPVG